MRPSTRCARPRRHLTGLGAGLLLAAGAVACSDDAAEVEQDPAGALRDAVAALADHDGVELAIAVDGDEQALATELEDDEAAQLLLESTVLVRASGETEQDAQVEVVVDLAGTEAAEVRVLPEQRLFLRLDVDAIGAAVDDPGFTASVDEVVGMAETFGLGEVAGTVRDGDWIELTGLEQLGELVAGGEAEEPDEEEAADLQERIVGALERFVDQDLEVEPIGSEDAGERVRATTTGAQLQRLIDEIDAIVAEAGGVDPADVQPERPEIPADETVTVDAWIEDGALSQVGYDLSAGEDGAPADTWLLIGVTEFTGTIDAPEAATEFDLFGLIGGFLGGADGAGLGDLAELGEPPAADDDGPGTPADEDLDGALPGECLPQELVDDLRDQASEEELAELDAAIDQGFLEVC